MAEGEAIPKYFKNQSFSDVTIILQGRKIPAHRVVLAAESSFFDKLFTGSFKDSSASELSLEHDDPDAMEELIRFMYTQNSDGIDTHFGSFAIDKLCKLITVADKYGVARLRNVALRELLNILRGRYTRAGTRDVLTALAELPTHMLEPSFDQMLLVFREEAPQLVRHATFDALLDAHPKLERYIVYCGLSSVSTQRTAYVCLSCDYCFHTNQWDVQLDQLACASCQLVGLCEHSGPLDMSKLEDD
ncbi:BTB/POZ protein [Elsinoe ampelina]|uniref:BTB/POZ protein n=1 Tax=Elsinoe ampelina TaxID=302913 RepID=A0A6A6G4Q0_9PEZI|nr:BTB/POZ protein [Elsinoe ampelina]